MEVPAGERPLVPRSIGVEQMAAKQLPGHGLLGRFDEPNSGAWRDKEMPRIECGANEVGDFRGFHPVSKGDAPRIVKGVTVTISPRLSRPRRIMTCGPTQYI